MMSNSFLLDSTGLPACQHYAILPIYVDFPPPGRPGRGGPQLRRHLPQRADGPFTADVTARRRALAPVDLCDPRRDDRPHRPVCLGGPTAPRRVDTGGVPVSRRDERSGGAADALPPSASAGSRAVRERLSRLLG